MKRFNPGEIFFACGLILIGGLVLLGNLGWVAFSWNSVWPLILILFGIWLIWRAFQPQRSGSAFYGFGEYQPDLVGKTIRNENYSHGFGDCDLDLTRATIPDGKSTVRASLGFGDLKVLVPRDLAIRVKASAGFGGVRVFEQKHEGIGPSIDFQSDGYATATRQLDLEASVSFGEVKVIRGG